MPTSTLPRRAAALAALTLAGSALAGAQAAVAAPVPAVPGAAGDVKIHKVGTPFSDPRDEPKVCEFYLDATNFDVAPSLTYVIQSQPPSPSGATLNGTVALASGGGHSDPLALPDGQYKLTVTGGTGTPKEKVFHVDCPADASAAPSRAPQGGVHAGGGGLAESGAISPFAGAAAVGLVVAGGVVYFRLLRRRPDGAA
ncbi:hypothetical protein ACFYP4_28050 [Streptomyces sp. NPDC005551]|uniref:hypothetical protein n=1 Tax=unclassified Streptomyces TaxID=2593676 RepID=UPI0033D1DD1B